MEEIGLRDGTRLPQEVLTDSAVGRCKLEGNDSRLQLHGEL